MTIKLLESKVISQIAAGEVVERPASVVKELLENSLDAGASRVDIEIKNGGTELIRATDNGSGIAAAEVALAFERHATSKITATDDLLSVSTLGFRGEALPSLASVADIDMITRTAEEKAATAYRVRESKAQQTSAARAPGTTISVSRLFRQVPARLKFLKTPTTEKSRIAAVVTAYALARPDVSFSLESDGRNSLRTPGRGLLSDGVTAIYGAATASEMLAVDNVASVKSGFTVITISGLVSSPQAARHSRNRMNFFVNRRWVSVRSLYRAVEQAYHGLMPEGRYPVAVINISIDPAEVDVNIHPTKTEVKFRDEGAVFSAVQRAVREALVNEMPVHRIGDRTLAYNPASAPELPLSAPPAAGFQPVIHRAAPATSADETEPRETPRSALGVLRVIGQMKLAYIIAEGPDGLYIIDQHAAHERIMKEKITAARAGKSIEVQGFLEPVTIEVSPAEDASLRKHCADLAEFGFQVEPFGERSYLVRAVPAILNDRDWRQALREMLERGSADWLEHITNTMACHSAVRAGKELSLEEMRGLLRQLEEAALPHTCPHGRPTMVVIPESRLARQFGRT
jgi:DNA mismatch repair protein MutL